ESGGVRQVHARPLELRHRRCQSGSRRGACRTRARAGRINRPCAGRIRYCGRRADRRDLFVDSEPACASGSARWQASARAGGSRTLMTADPLWYKDAIIYQLHVKTFADSNGDGIGDFRGLTSRLDYIRDLGVDCIWILPMYPSPFRDDGYDIADYGSIHPSYGTLDDFREFLAAAHERGLKVITELVLNHTSDQHQWFKEARASKENPRRDWYVWSDTDDKYSSVRIIFSDTERSNWAWDPDSRQYYW